ncbi:hypothetical protein GW17_00034475 [Ensete ventricosum]|nr:hypothetical protein GW17_00034475 [Ensete ventricosum]
MANPPCNGDRLQLRPPCKGAAGHLQGAATHGRGRLRLARRGSCQLHACNGWPSAASLQEAAHGAPARGYPRCARKALPPARAVAPAATRSTTAYAGGSGGGGGVGG